MAEVLLKLQIVWRNPQPVRRNRRWELVQDFSNSTYYVVQEFVSAEKQGFWYAIFNHEFISRQSGDALAQNRRLRVG